jgi:ABC-2 type transport system permease protein
MRGVGAIYEREMRSYFTSPIAYVVATVFLALVGVFLMSMLRQYIGFDASWRERLLSVGQEPFPASINDYLFRPLLKALGTLSLLVLPFITMASFAEEHRAGTMELLMTSPLNERNIVLGKFLAAATIYLLLLVAAFLVVSSLFLFGDPHVPSLLVGFLGLFMQGLSFIVIGLFISSLTRSQMVAGLGGLGAALLLSLAGLLGDPNSTIGAWLSDLSLVNHFDDFSKGILDSKHLVYYGCMIFCGLLLTMRSIESLKYR